MNETFWKFSAWIFAGGEAVSLVLGLTIPTYLCAGSFLFCAGVSSIVGAIERLGGRS